MKFRFNVSIETGTNEHPSNEIIEPTATLKFDLDYPLTNSYHFEETHTDGRGWSQRELVDAVCRAYAHVYAAEGADPGHIPQTLNRERSYGRFGIWGHDIGDLVLELAERLDDGSWSIGVGS